MAQKIPNIVNIGIVSRYETVISSLTLENLNLFASTKPKCSLVATRADNIEPIAPLILSIGGSSTSSIGNLSNEDILDCIAKPAKIDTDPPIIKTGRDSLTIRFTNSMFDHIPIIIVSTEITKTIIPRVIITKLFGSNKEAISKDGIVTLSPIAVIRGAATLSKSQFLLTHNLLKNMVHNRTIAVGTIPPITEIIKNSSIDIEFVTSKLIATNFATTANNMEAERESSIDA